MPDEATISKLTDAAMERNKRSIEILTTFFQEASVLVFVFGILDTYSSGKLTVAVGEVVGFLGFALLIAAFVVKSVFYRMTRRSVSKWLSLQEQSTIGGTK
jgi:divalent metal cation (Fe/Co/Zn/Cd) transporter